MITWRDGELSVTRIDGPFQVATNSRLEGTEYRCQRHTRAQQVLSQTDSVSQGAVVSALDALHQVGPYFTTYSTVYDLRAKTVTVYNLAQFDEPIVFNLEEELAKGEKTYKLAKLFERSPRIRDVKKLEPRRDFGTRVEVEAASLERFEGVYSPAPGVSIHIERHGGELSLTTQEASGPQSTRLFPEAENLFRIAPDHGQVSFHVTKEGKVEGLTLHRRADAYAERVDHLP